MAKMDTAWRCFRTSTLVTRLCLSCLLAVTALSSAWGREITDMVGRKVTIPDKITKVYASDPYTNVLLYVVAPDLSLGSQPGCLPFRPEDRQFLRKEIAGLPELATQPVLSRNSSGSLDAATALSVAFPAVAYTPALRGAEDGWRYRVEIALAGTTGDRHRGAAAVAVRDASRGSDSEPRG